jgi:hypothetical protein
VVRIIRSTVPDCVGGRVVDGADFGLMFIRCGD